MSLEFNDILLYADANGKVKIEVIYEDETFWLNQKKMAVLLALLKRESVCKEAGRNMTGPSGYRPPGSYTFLR
jgi:hypothetical protein